jgi:hypothetical protein
MDREPDGDAQAVLTRGVSRMLAGTSAFTAPPNLEARVLAVVEQRMQLPWWRRRVPEWPWAARVVYGLAGLASAAALLLGRPATSPTLHAMVNQPAAVLRRPAADLHATLDVLSVFHRLTDTLAASVPDVLWYGGIILCASAYVALFFLVVFGYRLLQAPAASR